jgi:hypothetical protein
VIGRSQRSVGDAQKEIGANGVAIAADVTKSVELDAVFQTVREKYVRSMSYMPMRASPT